MRKIWVVLFAVVLVLALAGCGAIRNQVENKIGEAIGEKVLGDNVDIEGDQITVKGDDGSEMVIGGTQWPDSELAKKIPKFEKGKVTSVIKADTGVMITMEEVSPEDFLPYLADIKSKFDKNSYEAASDGVSTYTASNADGVVATVSYTESDKGLLISVAQGEKPAESD